MVETLRTQAELIWPIERPLLELLGFPAQRRLLDLGCGTGEFAGRAAAAWPDLSVTGLDLFDGHLEVARRRHPSRIEFVRGDARGTGLEAGRFDIVVVRHLLQAIGDREAVLVEARRLLRPGGLLYVLAEDYAGMLIDADRPARSLFTDAESGVLGSGTDLLHGRSAFRDVRAAGFRSVRVHPLVVDTQVASRDVFYEMLGHWRDGYAEFLAAGMGLDVQAVAARFDALADAVRDPERYAAWLLFAVTATKHAAREARSFRR